jgi:hypothetical protein
MNEPVTGDPAGGDLYGVLPYWFKGYGLLFCSSIPVPEMTAVDPVTLGPDIVPDVRITTGRVPEHLDDPLRVGVHYEASAKQFLLRVKDVGHYLISRGDEVLMDRYTTRRRSVRGCFGCGEEHPPGGAPPPWDAHDGGRRGCHHAEGRG